MASFNTSSSSLDKLTNWDDTTELYREHVKSTHKPIEYCRITFDAKQALFRSHGLLAKHPFLSDEGLTGLKNYLNEVYGCDARYALTTSKMIRHMALCCFVIGWVFLIPEHFYHKRTMHRHGTILMARMSAYLQRMNMTKYYRWDLEWHLERDVKNLDSFHLVLCSIKAPTLPILDKGKQKVFCDADSIYDESPEWAGVGPYLQLSEIPNDSHERHLGFNVS